MSNNLKVFVYGTLKPGEANYSKYCQGKVIQWLEAYTWGRLFHLPCFGYPAMTRGTQKVKGILLTFAQESDLIALDQLEDYNPYRHPSENEYERLKAQIYHPSGQPLGEAWTYLMSLDKVIALGGIPVPSGWWTQKMAQKSIYL